MVVHKVNFVPIRNAVLKLFSVKMYPVEVFCKQIQLVLPAKMYYVYHGGVTNVFNAFKSS